MCVYILFRKFLSLFRHFLRIGCWQDVGCEVLQAVSVGTVKNLSSQYICTHALQGVDAHLGQVCAVLDMMDSIMAGAHVGFEVACVYILFRKFLKRERISYESYRNKRNRHRAAYSSKI